MISFHQKSWRDDSPPERITPESIVIDRRRMLSTTLLGSLMALCPIRKSLADSLYPAKASPLYPGEEPVSDSWYALHYNNFYEFGSHKNIWRKAQRLPISPWAVTVDGLVEKPFQIDFDTLIRRVSLEERVYRLRCVEAWSLVIPWTGFPLKKLIDIARPLNNARFLQMETFHNPEIAVGQTQFWYPWPYTEGLTLEEASHDLAFLATGLYGKPLPPQNGAPLRLVVPWKYGFKSIKSIVRFHFTQKRPLSFWESVAPSEYGFWANVNPNVPHPRWSQKKEKRIDSGEEIPTRLFNGYTQVASLYSHMDLDQEILFR